MTQGNTDAVATDHRKPAKPPLHGQAPTDRLSVRAIVKGDEAGDLRPSPHSGRAAASGSGAVLHSTRSENIDIHDERAGHGTSRVTIYSSSVCPFCHTAKRLMDSLGVAYDEVVLDDKPEVRQRLSDENMGFRTVPMIFAGSEFLGGFQDVMALHSRGDLLPRLGR
jgi:glutaredoxin 3